MALADGLGHGQEANAAAVAVMERLAAMQPTSLPELFSDCDRALLGQLLENVVKNGVEAQPSGGFLQAGIHRKGAGITITIASGGFTLAAGESGQIFEPYFTTKTQGTGLGLAISRKIVEAHGGTIQARPDLAQQSLTLIIELPTGDGETTLEIEGRRVA